MARTQSHKFKPRAVYQIGVLRKDADTSQPHGAWRLRPSSISGSALIKMGCRTAETFFEKNPMRLRMRETYTIYELDSDGRGVYLLQSVFTSPGPAAGMADNIGADLFPASDAVPVERGASVKDIAELMREQNDSRERAEAAHREHERALVDKLEIMAASVAEATAQARVFEAAAEHERQRAIDRQAAEKEFQDLLDENAKEMQKNSGGLADPALMSGLAQLISAIAPIVPMFFKSATPPPAAVPLSGLVGADGRPAPTRVTTTTSVETDPDLAHARSID